MVLHSKNLPSLIETVFKKSVNYLGREMKHPKFTVLPHYISGDYFLIAQLIKTLYFLFL